MYRVLILVIAVMLAAANIQAQTAKDLKRNETAVSQIRQNSHSDDRVRVKPRVLYVGPPTTYLKEGLRTQEVLRLLGQPSVISERIDDGVVVSIYEFPRGEGRILVAEFAAGVLVRSRITTRD